MKIRVRFAKEGIMKFIGHLDTMRYFQKALRRAQVDIRCSEGFSPHPIMSFAAPLGVGITSRGEYVDIEVLSTGPSAEMVRRLNETMTEGMEILSYRRLPDQEAPAMSVVAAADYTVRFRKGYEPEDPAAFAEGLLRFLDQEQILCQKKTKKGWKEWDIRPLIYRLTIEEAEEDEDDGDGKAGPVISMQAAAGSAANLKPEMVIGAYYESRGKELPPFALMIHRDEVYANRAAEGEEESRLCPLEEFGEDILE